MGKITNALNKASEERAKAISPTEEHKKSLMNIVREEKMRKSWVIWGIIVVVLTVFIALNYQGGQDAVPLSEIFPDENDVEYEFVLEDSAALKTPEVASPEVAVSDNIKKTASSAQAEQAQPTDKGQAISSVTSTVAVNEESNFTVQIASFKDKIKAQGALEKIRANVPSAYISRQDLGVKGVWYRIYAGQFELRSQAEGSLSAIKKSYDSSFIISPKKSR